MPIMYSVWKNAKCLKRYKTLRGAYEFYLSLVEKSNEERDCIELYSPSQDLLYWF